MEENDVVRKTVASLAVLILVLAAFLLWHKDDAPPDTPEPVAAPTAAAFQHDEPPAPIVSPPAAAAHRPLPAPPLPPRVTGFINTTYASSATTREALTQIAHGWSMAVNEVRSPQHAKAAGNAIAEGIACALHENVLDKAGVSPQEMLDRISATRAVMLDSEADTLAYIRFQSLAGGQYFQDPGSSSCRFDPSSLTD